MNLLKALLILLTLVAKFSFSAETTNGTAIKGHSLHTINEIESAAPVIQTESVPSQPDFIYSNEEQITPTRAGEKINWQVVSSGGTTGISTNFKLSGTTGQTAVGTGISTGYNDSHGYWQLFGTTICDCEPGEADEASPINILDIVYLINYKYKGGSPAEPYEICSGDPNSDCAVNILDIVYLINFKYKAGPIPVTCEEWKTTCGSLQK